MNNSAAHLDWNAIDTVLLDMDGTLLDLYYDNHFWLDYLPQRYAQQHATSLEQARTHLIEIFAAQRGSLNWYCVDYWTEQLGLDIAELKREIAHLIAIRPHTEAFLQSLRQRSQRVWLVTNAHRKSLALKMEYTGLTRWFDRIICSHDLHLPKEQPEFWARLQQAHPFDPARTLLIDDTASVLASAQQFGIGHLLTLLQPDSRQAQRMHTEFPAILHFDEIMPAP